jgi:hypothetical protein
MTTHKYIKADEEAIKQMQISTPDFYDEMVDKYGIENVINNLLIEAVVLTEDKSIVAGMNNSIKVDRELINKAKRYNNGLFNVYIKEPVHKLKASLSGVNDEITKAYVPVGIEHKGEKRNGIEDRRGYVVGGSYRTVDIDGKLHLLCKQVLISPEAKFNYLSGLWREQSPTITPKTGKITEVSFVNIPAQMTNISLSSATDTAAPVDEWEVKIEEAKYKHEQALQDYKLQQKESRAISLTKQLMKKGIITSAKKEEYKEFFVQLSAPHDEMAANLMLNIKQSPLNNKPRQVFLQGNLYMTKNKEDRFLEFSKENSGKYLNAHDLQVAFNKFEATAQVSLSAGVGEISDPMEDILSKLLSMQESGALTDECKTKLKQFCGHDVSLGQPTGNAVGDGKTVDAGTQLETPNNTSLSAPIADVNLVEVLQSGFNAQKSRAEIAEAKATELEAKLNVIKQNLGG